MEPWNKFHVTEYTASNLNRLVGKVFPNVQVQGLFATPGFYEIEFNRCNRKRLAARSPIGKARRFAKRSRTRLIRALKAVLPATTVMKIQAHVRRAEVHKTSNQPETGTKAGPGIKAISGKWSLDDLFYRDEDLDRALDLIAIAQNQPT
jgi:hypothetical protein